MAPKPPPPPPAPAPKNKWVVSATELKTLGNEAFTRKPNPDYYSAAQRYTHALRELDEVSFERQGSRGDPVTLSEAGPDYKLHPIQSGADNEPEPLALRCTLLQNRAACRLNLRYYQQCIDVRPCPCVYALPA